MLDYLLNVLGSDGHIIASYKFMATDNSTAITIAEEKCKAHRFELWQETRFIGLVEPYTREIRSSMRGLTVS